MYIILVKFIIVLIVPRSVWRICFETTSAINLYRRVELEATNQSILYKHNRTGQTRFLYDQPRSILSICRVKDVKIVKRCRSLTFLTTRQALIKTAVWVAASILLTPCYFIYSAHLLYTLAVAENKIDECMHVSHSSIMVHAEKRTLYLIENQIKSTDLPSTYMDNTKAQ